MRIRGVGVLRSGIRRVSNLLRSRAIVLLYHRIAELHPDPQLLCVTPAHFAQHLEHLRRYYQPISLKALRQAFVSGDVPHKVVVVTFDDGYADNLRNAKPLLESCNVPATVFVTAGYVGRDREFPHDYLERCLLQQRTLPDSLTLAIDGRTYSWQIGGFKDDVGAWNVLTGSYPSLRHLCYCELHRLLRPLNDESRQLLLNALANWSSCPTDARPDRRALNEEELRTLSEDGLVEIGAHGVNHLVLAAQPAEAQWKEINESRRHLESILGRPVTTFSYPYGGSEDINETTVELVKKAGFNVACANIPAPVTVRSDLFRLPRFLVRDWDGQEFGKRLKRAFC
jgi:peptidoglycan/xylan/chitin deacetylase (PgdA/CDA1 family)